MSEKQLLHCVPPVYHIALLCVGNSSMYYSLVMKKVKLFLLLVKNELALPYYIGLMYGRNIGVMTFSQHCFEDSFMWFKLVTLSYTKNPASSDICEFRLTFVGCWSNVVLHTSCHVCHVFLWSSSFNTSGPSLVLVPSNLSYQLSWRSTNIP
jgi:hypothetical protein